MDSTDIILKHLQRIEEGLGGIREQLSSLSERTTNLEAWRDATFANIQRTQELHAERIRTVEREQALRTELTALEARVRHTEQTAAQGRMVSGAISLVVGSVASFIFKLLAGE